EAWKSLARALDGAGYLASNGSQNDLAAAQSYFEELLSIGRERDDAWSVAAALWGLGDVATSRGEMDAGRSLWEEGLAVSRKSGDQWHLALFLIGVGLLA